MHQETYRQLFELAANWPANVGNKLSGSAFSNRVGGMPYITSVTSAAGGTVGAHVTPCGGQMDNWDQWKNESEAQQLLSEVNLPHLLQA